MRFTQIAVASWPAASLEKQEPDGGTIFAALDEQGRTWWFDINGRTEWRPLPVHPADAQAHEWSRTEEPGVEHGRVGDGNVAVYRCSVCAARVVRELAATPPSGDWRGKCPGVVL